jgi:hypothetical protein
MSFQPLTWRQSNHLKNLYEDWRCKIIKQTECLSFHYLQHVLGLCLTIFRQKSDFYQSIIQNKPSSSNPQGTEELPIVERGVQAC